MDSQTALVFVLVTILTFLFALRETPHSDIARANRSSPFPWNAGEGDAALRALSTPETGHGHGS
jgi:hypothetical protein